MLRSRNSLRSSKPPQPQTVYLSAIPLAIMFYYDRLEVVNALVHAKGVQKLSCFYWTLINLLSPSHRTALHNIHLASFCLEKDVSRYGPDVVVSGQTDEPEESSSWGAAMPRLN
eukprot:2412597-Pleurochrysis_carterae.AAC.2